MGGGCPLGYGTATGDVKHPAELQESVRAFQLLLPNCAIYAEELHACRGRVVAAGAATKLSWRVGMGRGHCVPESDALVSCNRRRSDLVVRISSACAHDGTSMDIGQVYAQCIKEKSPTACAPVVANFLDCARALTALE